MFSLFAKYLRYGIRATFFEASGGFKALGPIIRREETRRQEYLALRTFPAAGDKDVRIRTELSQVMKPGLLYVVDPFMEKVRAETVGFPQSSKKDILDMLSSGVKNSRIPNPPEEEMVRDAAYERWVNRKVNRAGW